MGAHAHIQSSFSLIKHNFGKFMQVWLEWAYKSQKQLHWHVRGTKKLEKKHTYRKISWKKSGCALEITSARVSILTKLFICKNVCRNRHWLTVMVNEMTAKLVANDMTSCSCKQSNVKLEPSFFTAQKAGWPWTHGSILKGARIFPWNINICSTSQLYMETKRA